MPDKKSEGEDEKPISDESFDLEKETEEEETNSEEGGDIFSDEQVGKKK